MTRALLSLVLAVTLGSCTQRELDRAVSVRTSACGHASGTSGAGVIVDNGLVLVAAHVVIGGTDITVSIDGETKMAQIIRLDSRTDLAVLSVQDIEKEPVKLGRVEAGSKVEIVGGGPSPEVTVAVSRLVEIRIEEERSSIRSSRDGFEIDHRVELGDSGSGVFDRDGRLVGIVFGRMKSDRDRSFVVDADEISKILYESADQRFVCDPDLSKVSVAGG